MRVSFSVDAKPLTLNDAYRHTAGRGVRKSPEYLAWQARVQFAARRAMSRGRQLAGDLEVSLLLAFPTRRNDIDGPVKGILDAMQGIVYANDRQVRRLVVECYALTQGTGVEGRAVPGVDVAVSEMDVGLLKGEGT